MAASSRARLDECASAAKADTRHGMTRWRWCLFALMTRMQLREDLYLRIRGARVVDVETSAVPPATSTQAIQRLKAAVSRLVVRVSAHATRADGFVAIPPLQNMTRRRSKGRWAQRYDAATLDRVPLRAP